MRIRHAIATAALVLFPLAVAAQQPATQPGAQPAIAQAMTAVGPGKFCKFARYLAQISRATWHSTGTYLTRRRCVKWGQESAVMRTTLVPSARSMARLV
jgi:hypothetical protein